MNKKSIVITGASDGIGKSLAWEMARRGYNLGLTARRLPLLEQLKQDIQEQHPDCKIEIAALDVTHYEQVKPTIELLAQGLGKIDILLANAGVAKSGVIGKTPLAQHLSVIDTNVSGAIATVDAGLRVFRQQGHGHLVATSSVAAFRGLARNAVYSASKAALSTFMEGVRVETLKDNIDVTVLHPGFIDTAINRDLANRPFVIDVEEGAKIFANLIEQKVARSTVPRMPWSIVGQLLKHLPTSVIAKM